MKNRPKGVKEQREFFLRGCDEITRVVEDYCDEDFPQVLGVDPARGSTGWALREKGDKITTGAIVSSSGMSFAKVIYIEKRLRKMLDKSTGPLIAIEGYAMNSRYGRELAGEIGGVLRRLFYYKKRPMLVISPLTIKAWIQAKKKEHIMLEILDKYKIKIANNDAADAFILQEIGHKTICMSKAVMDAGLTTADDVKSYLKNQVYKNNNKCLENLFRYQENSLFNLISNQGTNVKFFAKEPYAMRRLGTVYEEPI